MLSNELCFVIAWNRLFSNIHLGYCSEGADRDRSMSGESTTLKMNLRMNMPVRRVLQQQSTEDGLTWIPETTIEKMQSDKHASNTTTMESGITSVEIEIHRETPSTPPADSAFGHSPTTIITTSSSVDTLTGDSNTLNAQSGPSSPSNLSSVTLVGSTGSGSGTNERDKDLTPTQEGSKLFKFGRAPTSPLPERKRKPVPKDSDDSTDKSDSAKSDSEKDKQLMQTPVKVSVTASISAPSTIPAPPTVTKTVHEDIVKATKPEVVVSSKPTIVSTIAKIPDTSGMGGRTSSPFQTPTKSSATLQPNMNYLTMNRRPSAGANVIPVAALCQHRHSLQLNGSDMGIGMHKVSVL